MAPLTAFMIFVGIGCIIVLEMMRRE